jgi:hypothetical protein
MTPNLPDIVKAYFEATNAHAPDRVAACFELDARVRDDGRDHQGRDAIRAWAEESDRKYSFQAEVLSAEQEAGRLVVTAHLTGDFPGNPVDLRFQFRLAERIAALEIAG